MKKHFVFGLGFVLLVALLATGCGAETTPPPVEAGGLTVTDALGRTVELDGPPQRIVLAGRAVFMVANLVYAFPGAGERVVAIEYREEADMGKFLPLVEPSYAEKRTIETDAGPEQIAPLNPDLVMLKSYTSEGVGAALEEIGLPVVYLDLEKPEGFLDDIEIVGKVLGNEQRAAELLAFYRERLDRIEEATGGLEDSEKPRVLVVFHSNQGGEIAFNVSPPGWMQATQTEMAGGIPVWLDAGGGEGWSVVGFEQIAAWDPDYVFVLAYRQDPVTVTEGLKVDAGWQALRCVKEGRIYPYPSDFYTWDMPETHWILGVTWMAHTLHPDSMPVDMQQEVYDFYREIYGLDVEAVDENIMPILRW